MDKQSARRSAIDAFLQGHPYITNADVRGLLGVSAATANRILAGLTGAGNLKKIRVGGHWAYTRG